MAVSVSDRWRLLRCMKLKHALGVLYPISHVNAHMGVLYGIHMEGCVCWGDCGRVEDIKAPNSPRTSTSLIPTKVKKTKQRYMFLTGPLLLIILCIFSSLLSICLVVLRCLWHSTAIFLLCNYPPSPYCIIPWSNPSHPGSAHGFKDPKKNSSSSSPFSNPINPIVYQSQQH